VPTGSTVELSAAVSKMDDETFVFSGEARCGNEVVQTIRNCNGYFMPLGELEDPEVTKKRFRALVEGGIQQFDDEGPAFPFDALLTTTEKSPDGISCRATFDPGHTFYRDHFPRMPVTPIVILNETIGAAAQRLLAPRQDQLLRVRKIQDIKIRNFVRPGETVEAVIKVEGRDGSLIRTVADLVKDGKRILRGRYDYQLTEPV
jgi:3-hydroxymyristoyl/3-hydroxydecanoyl-(acyl carrier protein) dehydratase